MEKGYIVINVASMSDAEFENLMIFLEKLANEQIKKSPEGG